MTNVKIKKKENDLKVWYNEHKEEIKYWKDKLNPVVGGIAISIATRWFIKELFKKKIKFCDIVNYKGNLAFRIGEVNRFGKEDFSYFIFDEKRRC